ncbi:MAG TPA: hypothetical protein VFF61_09570, partial [Microvirga sp.]|nr:hypothetical protein [Microvirga sp.]
MAQTSSAATARAALRTTLGAAFEAALGRSPGAALEATAATARSATGGAVTAWRATAGAIFASLATSAEGTITLASARPILATLAGAERAVACRTARAFVLVTTGAACTGLALEAGRRRIAVVTTTGTILATGRRTPALARCGRLFFLRLTHEAFHHDLAALGRCDGANALARALRAGRTGLARIGAATRHFL